MKRSGRWCARALPWAALVLVYVLMVSVFALYGSHNLNADDSSEMVLAAQLNEEGAFLSENWLYSTELRVISPVPLYQLGLKLFDSWHAARTFAQAVVLLGIAVCTLYLAYETGMKRSAPYLAAVFILPFSFEYMYIMLLGCYYAVHLMLALVMLGLVFRLGRKGIRAGKGAFALLLALGFLCGLGGLRMLTMLVAPLCLASAVQAVCACAKHKTFRLAACEPAVHMAVPVMISTAAAAVGYAVNAKVLGAVYSYQTYGNMWMRQVNVTDFANQINGIIRTFGYRDGAALFSMQGISCWAALGLTAALVLSLVCLYAKRRDIAPQHALLGLTAVSAIGLGMMLNVFLGQLLVRYFIVGTMLAAAWAFALLDTAKIENERLRSLLIAALACCFAFQSACTMRYDVKRGEVNYEMAAQWLEERGYTQGYATFWNANTLTEASDGKIRMWVLTDSKKTSRRNDWTGLEMQETLQHRDHLTQDPKGKVFLLVDEIENQSGSPLLDRERLVGELIGWSYYVYEFESADQMRALIAE